MNIADYFQTLDESTDDTLQIVKGFSSAQLRFKKNDGWNILEVLEHIVIVERAGYSFLSKPSEYIAETSELFGKTKLYHLTVESRQHKIPAPERLMPKGEIHNVETFMKIFTDQRKQLKQDIETGKIVVDNKTQNHPIFGKMTISDWLHFIPFHTQRHVEQIKEMLML